MTIKIKLVEKCPRGEYGSCQITSDDSILIKISKTKNDSREQFSVTLLHEILHAWLFIMKANGFKIPIRKEHKWIYSVQGVVFEALKLLK